MNTSRAKVPPPGNYENDQARLKEEFGDWVIFGSTRGVTALRGEGPAVEQIGPFSPGLVRCMLMADRDRRRPAVRSWHAS